MFHTPEYFIRVWTDFFPPNFESPVVYEYDLPNGRHISVRCGTRGVFLFSASPFHDSSEFCFGYKSKFLEIERRRGPGPVKMPLFF